MQTTNKLTLEQRQNTTTIAGIEALITQRAREQRQDFIHKYNKSPSGGCISEACLEYFAAVPLSSMEYMMSQGGQCDSASSRGSELSKEDILSKSGTPCGVCMQQDTLEMFQSPVFGDTYHDEEAQQQQLECNQLL